uniref:Uncharacterized protein n=1 Tax=Brassica oleracea var. oleracea TaxID=109376 RepID=A0A0D3C576_BRAOL
MLHKVSDSLSLTSSSTVGGSPRLSLALSTVVGSLCRWLSSNRSGENQREAGRDEPLSVFNGTSMRTTTSSVSSRSSPRSSITTSWRVHFGKITFFPGRLIHTNECLVFLGENYYTDRTSKQTVDVLRRRNKTLQSQIHSLKAEIDDFQTEASSFANTASEAAEGVLEIREEYEKEEEDSGTVFQPVCGGQLISCIGVPHGVLGDIWVCLELERGVKMIIGRAERWERLPGATPASRSDLPFQSDLTRAMRRSRSPFHPGGSRKLTRSDLSERPLQVAPEAQSDLARVTPRGRSHFYRMTTTQWSQSDLSQRHSEVAPEVWSDYSERRAEVAPRLISARTYDFSRAFWSFHDARFYFLNLCFNTL